jgi:hypothetical protein
MTRSGLAAAIVAATCANGQADGTLQFWNLPPSSSSRSFALPLAAFRRQPVSPKAAIDFSSAFGSGSGEFPMLADDAAAGIGSSQISTGKVGSGVARTFIGCSRPSTVIAGQRVASATTARATAPCGPSTT